MTNEKTFEKPCVRCDQPVMFLGNGEVVFHGGCPYAIVMVEVQETPTMDIEDVRLRLEAMRANL
jgi:hypothetical protein